MAELPPDQNSIKTRLQVGDHPNALARRALAGQLHGEGIEFGPGCHPLPLRPFACRPRYCDKLSRAEYADAFPEAAGEIHQFPDPLAFHFDFEREDFAAMIGESSVDFVVANHVLEHLVNPLAFLERCHRLLQPSGLLYLSIPDPRSCHDRDRRRTRLADVVDRYRRGESELTDDAIVRFVNEAERPLEPFGPGSSDYQWRMDRHRLRSIHVNVWTAEDLIELLEHLGRSLRRPWELVDGLVCPTECIFVLRRSDEPSVLDRYSVALGRVWFDSHRHAMREEFGPRLEELERLLLAAHDRLMLLDERGRETQRFVQQIKSALERLPGGKSVAKWFGKRARP